MLYLYACFSKFSNTPRLTLRYWYYIFSPFHYFFFIIWLYRHRARRGRDFDKALHSGSHISHCQVSQYFTAGLPMLLPLSRSDDIAFWFIIHSLFHSLMGADEWWKRPQAFQGCTHTRRFTYAFHSLRVTAAFLSWLWASFILPTAYRKHTLSRWLHYCLRNIWHWRAALMSGSVVRLWWI